MSYGTINADVIGTSVANSNIGAGNASIMKNRIINGAMVIDQRNAGASVTPTLDNTYTLDRWSTGLSQASKFSVQQNAGSVTPPVGFSNYLGVTSLANTSLAAGDYFMLKYTIEGFNTSDLMFGTANAKTITLSFQVYSSLTGTFGGSLQNSAQNRSYPFSYSIPVANTWTTVSVTIAGDTTGTWIGATNGKGLTIWYGLGVGSTYSGTVNTWAGASYFAPTGATSVVGTSGATFYITGVQLEVGSSATGFEYVNYQTSLANCQRYYYIYKNAAASFPFVPVWLNSSTNGLAGIRFAVPMRASPTFTSSGIVQWTPAGSSQSLTSITLTDADGNGARIDTVATSAVYTAGQVTFLQNSAAGGGVMSFNAEL